MTNLRSTPPDEIGGRKVESVEDLELGVGGLPPTDGLRYRVEGGGRVSVRPSGTEPKIKCYLEVVQAVVGEDLGGARSRAAATLADLDAGMRELLEV
jgi:phosphomannomutase